MERCALCGRKLSSKSSILGLSCLKKMCLQVGITDVKNLSGINLLNEEILKLNNKKMLPAKQTTYLTDRYLTLSLLDEVQGYSEYKEVLKNDINLIDKTTKISELRSFDMITLKQAAEINKYYTKYETFFEKLMNGEFDFIQEISVDLMRFSFSSYYNKKEYLSDMRQKLQYSILKCFVGGLKIINCEFASECLNNALQENPEDIIITEGDIIEEITNDEEFKEAINNIIQKYDCNNFYAENESFSFNNNMNLFFTFHNVNINISGQKQENNTWNLDIVMFDVYDFTELKKLEEYISNEKYIISFGAAFANNLGLIATSCKVVYPYNITIAFSLKDWNK